MGKKKKAVNPEEITPEFLMGYAQANSIEYTKMSCDMGFDRTAMYNWVQARNGISKLSKIKIAAYMNKKAGVPVKEQWMQTPLFTGEAQSFETVLSNPVKPTEKSAPKQRKKEGKELQSVGFLYKGESLNAIPGELRLEKGIWIIVVYCNHRKKWVSVPLQEILTQADSPEVIPVEAPLLGSGSDFVERPKRARMNPANLVSADSYKEKLRSELNKVIKNFSEYSLRTTMPVTTKSLWIMLHQYFGLNSVEDYNISQLSLAIEKIKEHITHSVTGHTL